MKIGVVGSGISGLSAAYYLSKKHQVDLFEKEDHFGGHSHTIDLLIEEKKISVDIGFIVFNHKTYPNLIKFFDENKVHIEKSDMSFAVSVKEFYKNCERINQFDQKITLGDYLVKNKLSDSFINFHLIPMVSAIWSMPPYEASKMPLKFFLKFFQNHGLFKLKNRPQWYTVAKRSRTYVAKVLSSISGEYYKNYNVNRLIRRSNGIDLYYGDKSEFFSYDKVVLASHADQALSIIDEPTKEEQEILSKFKYRENIAVIHTDESIMPNNKDIWSSWNSSVDKNNVENNSITYWLNLLQNLDFNKNIFLTLNPNFKINEDKILKKVNFTHPYFDQSALDNQDKLKNLQNKKNLLFCGSYFGYGFHEDGIKSSIEMIKAIDD